VGLVGNSSSELLLLPIFLCSHILFATDIANCSDIDDPLLLSDLDVSDVMAGVDDLVAFILLFVRFLLQ